MIAWLIAAGRALLGESELGGAALAGARDRPSISLAIYRTGRLLFDARTAGIGGHLVQPDARRRADVRRRARRAGRPVLDARSSGRSPSSLRAATPTGGSRPDSSSGWALLSKYTIGVPRRRAGALPRHEPRATRLARASGRSGRAARSPLLVFLPNLIWNAQHDWASVAFQGSAARRDFGRDFGSLQQPARPHRRAGACAPASSCSSSSSSAPCCSSCGATCRTAEPRAAGPHEPADPPLLHRLHACASASRPTG